MNKENTNWIICPDCKGLGKKKHKLSKKARLKFEEAMAKYENLIREGNSVTPPIRTLYVCANCSGSGLIESTIPPIIDEGNYPHIAIVGGGIGGVALAVACKHRGIPFTLYERDQSFDDRSQGYGLTLQQASNEIRGLGIFNLKDGLTSTRHVVHTPDGKIIGEWGPRKWLNADVKKTSKRNNVHIARQSLRFQLLEQLSPNLVQWNHKFLEFKENDNGVDLSFEVNGEIKNAKADFLVGADGIRSAVRNQLIGEDISPLQYLDCIVILGICPLSALEDVSSPLLDSATVFQTVNGNERIYIMPYSSDTVMWQLSFPLSEKEAKELNRKGPKALKEEAKRRVPWHDPIPQIIDATNESLISGYPAYDREVLHPSLLEKASNITLIGDAAHPMSPFKGQGANQALLDALALARGISRECRPMSNWKEVGIRKSVLTVFESEMLVRSSTKVKASAEAAKSLHTNRVLHDGDTPRGRTLKKK